MGLPTNGLLVKLKALRIPDNLIWKTPKEFIKTLTEIVVGEFPGGENERTIVYGAEPPTADDLEKPWFQLDRTGRFTGWLYRFRNQWREAVVVGTVAPKIGDPNTPPNGWTALDGAGGLPDTKSLWKGAAPNLFYFAIFTGYTD